MRIISNYSLQYIVAVLMEVQRIGSIAPVSVGHRAMKDSELRGHIIPKVRLLSQQVNLEKLIHFIIFQDTIILISLHSLHNDPNFWKNPEEFRPERFLKTEAEGSLNSEYLAPFGLGV